MNPEVKDTDQVRVRLDLSYDGTFFSGWALQPNKRTVQGVLEDALQTLTRQNRIPLTVAGRTDAGVHAINQTCHFDIEREQLKRFITRNVPDFKESALRRLRGVLNKSKALDIGLNSIEIVPGTFDARFSAIRRRYLYRIRTPEVGYDPLSRFYTSFVRDNLDLNLMSRVSSMLVGFHDFGAFCKPRDGATTLRTLERFEWKVAPDGTLNAELSADAFCHSMVRNLVGAVVAVGAGRITQAQFTKIFHDAERTSHFKVMPASGLHLLGVDYPSPSEYESRANSTRAKRSI